MVWLNLINQKEVRKINEKPIKNMDRRKQFRELNISKKKGTQMK